MFPLAIVPFWVHIFDPQPPGDLLEIGGVIMLIPDSAEPVLSGDD